MGGTEKRPIASEETTEERAFGDDEEQASDRGDDMAAGVEEKELHMISLLIWYRMCNIYLGNNEGLDKHDNTACYDRGERDDVQTTHNVENDIAWTCQVLG